ncbi:flagellar biosynthetic protein FliR [Arcobacter sp. FWKO B]|uniref:flagellar biosynthetic protein FliR n=1 Tax=Arcobacter sp. FWKO B TaxID=2593672 RepID=UPI0018A365A3|nr:flagellar biosynthetic protein FliR [Arcobacter sp. FWKO B]QOG12003.1 flagellar biosynthetic protein FliR [Arcobacter sp. FWKO B]
MQELISLLDEVVLYNFLLLLGRVLAFVAFMPIFGHTSVSPSIRVAFAFYLSIFLFPIVQINPNINQGTFIDGLIGEITLGLVGSMFFTVLFSAVRIIGDFVSYATALSMANMFDPATGAQESLVSRFLYIIAILVFFTTGMYETTIVMLTASFGMVELGTFNLYSVDGLSIAIAEVKRMFAFAFAFAFPLFFIAFVLDIYYGYGTKSMPAFSPFVITFQLKFALIFLFMMFGMEMFVTAFREYFIEMFSY